jgi:hypothetical protein
MSKSRKSYRRQAAVLEDLFAGELDEQEILAKHSLDQDTYTHWLADPHFAALLERRIARAHHEARLILARYAPIAATKLVDLTQSEKEEVARKACLDIIALHAPADSSHAPPERGDAPDRRPARESAASTGELPAELASRLLAALAHETRPNGATVGPE